jgi:carbonic anhydrase/acetyltransferase-like protein (isoleucine patch superfamily)
MMRKVGSAFDSMGKGLEITKYTEKLVPSTRFVAVDGMVPKISDKGAFVAPSAAVIGDVTIGKASSIWYGATVRGDVNTITIGDYTNIGDRAVVHVARIQGDFATSIGNNVTIGAGALIHAATLKDNCVVGESAQVLDGATVESNVIIAPAAIVTPGTMIPSGELWAGSPAKMIRVLTEDEIAAIPKQASETAALASMHAIEHSKSYEQVMEEEQVAENELYREVPVPKQTENPLGDVLGQGMPGRIFRSTLSHPEDIYKGQQPK